MDKVQSDFDKLRPCNSGSAKTMPATGVAKPPPTMYSMDSIGARSALE